LFWGAIELLPELKYFGKVDDLLKAFVKAVDDVVVHGLDIQLATLLIDTVEEIMDAFMIKRREKDIDFKDFLAPHLYSILIMTIRAQGVFNAFKLDNKEDPDTIIDSKKQCKKILMCLTELSGCEGQTYLQTQLPTIITEYYAKQPVEHIGTWTIMSDKWRMFYAIFDQVNAKDMQMELIKIEADKPTEMKQVEITTHLSPLEEEVKQLAINPPLDDKPNNFFEELDADIMVHPKEFIANKPNGSIPEHSGSDEEDPKEQEDPVVGVVPEGEKPAEIENEDKENEV